MSALRDLIQTESPSEVLAGHDLSALWENYPRVFEERAVTVYRRQPQALKQYIPRKIAYRKPEPSTELPSEDDPKPAPSATGDTAARGRFVVLRQSEGVVIGKKDGSFWAKLVTAGQSHADEEAEFSMDEVTEFDRELVEPGAVFYWTIGFSDSPMGIRTRASMLRFRRLPVWGKVELEKARQNAERLADLFDAEPRPTTNEQSA